jgi:hypothetical protein
MFNFNMTHNFLSQCFFTIKKFLSRKSKGPLQNGHHLTQELVNFKSHLLPKHESGLSEFLF